MVTVDTNIAIYAFIDGDKAHRAQEVLTWVDFLSVQLCNEFVVVSRRKLKREWAEVIDHLDALIDAIPHVYAVSVDSHRSAIRIAQRYELAFFDSLMIAVALANGARTIYSEDMQHGLVIEDTLRIVNPFLADG